MALQGELELPVIRASGGLDISQLYLYISIYIYIYTERETDHVASLDDGLSLDNIKQVKKSSRSMRHGIKPTT